MADSKQESGTNVTVGRISALKKAYESGLSSSGPVSAASSSSSSTLAGSSSSSSSSVRGASASLMRSKSARQSSKSGTLTTLQDLKITLIGESQESRVAIFEEETFRNAQNITMELDLVGPVLKRTCQCIIIPCESSLGPRYPKWGLANDIVQYVALLPFTKKKKKKNSLSILLVCAFFSDNQEPTERVL